MIRVGVAGIGFMGMIHYLAYQRVRGVKVSAIAEPLAERRKGDWRGIKGNFGPAGIKMDLSGVTTYANWEEMIADPELDVIDVCLPPAAHAKATIAALKAGKHVFCEKPIAIAAADGAKMVRAAEQADKLLFIGHVLPFFPEYQFAYQAVTGGKYGSVLGGQFKRIISDPMWLKHFWDADVCGGPLLDLHIHDAHFIRLLFGMPNQVSSVGRLRGDVVEYLSSQFRYDDASLVVGATSGVINQQGRGFTHGYELHLEKATILFDMAVIGGSGETNMPVTLLDDKGKAKRPKLSGGGDEIAAFVNEIKEVVACVKAGKPSALLDGGLARDALILAHKQSDSVKKGKPVKV